MPIRIAHLKDRTEIAWLCDGIWELPQQLMALEKWVEVNKDLLPPGDYGADIGYSVRPGATGGGACLTPRFMSDLVMLGISLHLSEYDFTPAPDQAGDDVA